MPEQNIQPKTRTEFFLNRIARAVAGDAGWEAASGWTLVAHDTWVTADTPSGAVVIHTIDKTWQEISDAFLAGVYCCVISVVVSSDDGMPTSADQARVVGISRDGGKYSLGVSIGTNSVSYECDSSDGYPSYTQAIAHVVPGGDIDI